MESREEKRICIMEKAADEKSMEHNKCWFSVLDNSTLVSAAVKLMLSILFSSSVATIAFILKRDRSYDMDIMCILYVTVILLWIALMSVIFFRFMWSGVLKDKQQNIKACFAFGMAVNLLAVFSTTIYACASFDSQVLLFIMLFLGVFNSMAMLMFHETKTQKENKNRNGIYNNKIYEVPKGLEELVGDEQRK